MTRARIVAKVCSLLLYAIWREWICGQPSEVHPIELAVIAVKVARGADLGGLNA